VPELALALDSSVARRLQAQSGTAATTYKGSAVRQRPKLSVVVPFFNEEDSIEPMHAALVAALDALGEPYEMLFVDDGSKDRTLEIATDLARADERVRVVKFRRNYGQTAAMAAGIEAARGEIIVTMDGDLQNDPADIGAFLA
jgi:glycosyltransferase involved in cell wall biosynthesis